MFILTFSLSFNLHTKKSILKLKLILLTTFYANNFRLMFIKLIRLKLSSLKLNNLLCIVQSSKS